MGPTVVDEFTRAGFLVRATARRGLDGKLFPAGTELLTADIMDADSLRAVMRGADTVAHLAALLHVVNPPPSLIPSYHTVNVEGTRNVLDAARACGVRRVILASTIAVYGPTGGRVLDEGAPLQPETPYGRSKAEAEQVAMSYIKADGEPLCTVLRLAAVYGSRMQGNYDRLVRAVARRTFVQAGAGLNRRTVVYVRDVARAVVAAAMTARGGQIYNVTDGRFHTMNEIVRALALALGRRPPVLRVPVVLVRFAVSAMEALFGLVRLRAPVGTATVDKLIEDVAVDGSRIMRELGFSPDYDLQRGWDETIADMRARGDL